MQHTSKWQTHLLHLHLETFKARVTIHSLKTIKTQTQNHYTDAISWVTELGRYAHALSPVKKVL